jgi:hypothetical protein
MRGAKPKDGFAQQQREKKIPAVVRDTFFKNSLRVGMMGWGYLYTGGQILGSSSGGTVWRFGFGRYGTPRSSSFGVSRMI